MNISGKPAISFLASSLLCSSLAAVCLLNLNSCAVAVGGGLLATGAGASMLHDRRDSSAVITDEGIELRLRGKVNSTAGLKEATHLNITAYNGVVLLSGEVPSEDVRQQIVSIAQATSEVKHIHNALVVAPKSSLSRRSEDTLITARAKTALFNVDQIPGFDATQVKVVTEDRVVYLMGLLHQSEAEAVTDSIRRVKGVKQVVKIFEYIN